LSIDDALASNISHCNLADILLFSDVSSETHHLVGIAQDNIHALLENAMPSILI
jgi:hypothetical protein